MKIIKATLISILIFSFFALQAENFWETAHRSEVSQYAPQINTKAFNLNKLNVLYLQNYLVGSPHFELGISKVSEKVIEIPFPDGNFKSFYVFEYAIMEPELAERYPEIKTYMAVSTEGKHIYGKLDVTPQGFHAMIFTPMGTYFTDPYSQQTTEYYTTYWRKDFTHEKVFSCEFHEEEETTELETEILDYGETLDLEKSSTPKFGHGEELRTYRLAMAATGEYTIFHGGTVASALAAIVTTMNRVNGVYERDVAVRLILIGNTDQLIFTNPQTDPYTNGDAFEMLAENQTTINNIIGAANYDIGHVFGTNSGGVAGFGVVCNNNSKARGVTGGTAPIGDPFDIDFVAHEMGHQFRASHTFNSPSGGCAQNRSAANAYETGSGSTIMAYAGLCNPENLQNQSDDYFHVESFRQIRNFIVLQNGNTCPQVTPTGNSEPEITSITQSSFYTIPQSTPFEMEAQAIDPDGDVLSYCWEQFDQQDQNTAINNPTGNQPLFRSFAPTLNGKRVFPRWENILNGTQTIGELLPNYGREMKFRLLVRDNNPGAGGVYATNFADSEPPSVVRVTVANSAGPFVVNSPTNTTTWQSASTAQVTWDVAGTNQNPINCGSVDILLSIDGGENFNIVLAENVGNSGFANVQAPEVNTNQARVLVKCSNNIFFNVNNGNFNIEFDCTGFQTNIDIISNSPNQDACIGDNLELFVIASTPDLNLSYQWTFNGTPIQDATQNELTIQNLNQTNSGVYACIVSSPCNQVTTENISVQVTTLPETPALFFSDGEFISDFTATNQWYLNGEVIEGENSFTLTPEVTGFYSVSSIINGCASIPTDEISFAATSINSLEDIANINVYPNPSNGLFTVSITNWEKPIDIKVIDVIGKVIWQDFNQNQTIEIQFLNQPKGVYFVKVQSEGYQAVKKIVIN